MRTHHPESLRKGVALLDQARARSTKRAESTIASTLAPLPKLGGRWPGRRLSRMSN